MTYTNITINGLKVPVKAKSTIKNVIESFFDLRCEILVSRNSKPVPPSKYSLSKVKENDVLQIITYSEQCYKIKKRTIFKKGNEGNLNS